MDEIENMNEISVANIFGSDDSSSVDPSDFVNETESASQKRITMNSLNEKLSGMWEFMQKKNSKHKREKEKADKNRMEDRMFLENLRCQVKESVEKVNENLDMRMKSVTESFETRFNSMHEDLESFETQFDAKFEIIAQKQSDQMVCLERFEGNMVDFRKALIHNDSLLSDMNTRIVNFEEQQALLQTKQSNDETQISHVSDELMKLRNVNSSFQNELNRVDSFSKCIDQRCSNIDKFVKQVSQSVNERTNRLDSVVNEIQNTLNKCERQRHEMHDHVKNIDKLARENRCEINTYSRKFGEVDMRIEQLSDQIRDIKIADEIVQIVPAAESWYERGDEPSESEMDDHMESFHRNSKRHKPMACSREIPCDADESDNETPISISCPRNSKRVDDRSPHVNFENPCVTKEQPCLPQGTNDRLNFRKSNNQLHDKTPSNELNAVAQLMSQFIARSNIIPLPVFDGINADLSSYKRQCIAIAKQNGWTSQGLAVQIISSLQGDARSLMSLLPHGDENNLESIWKILNSRFDRTVSIEMAKNQLNNLQQKKGESFLHLQLEVERLIKRAYPLANEEMCNQLALDQFVKSINSNGVRYEVRLRNPKDLGQARHMAEEIAVIQASEKYQRLTYVNQITLTDRVRSSDTESDEESDMKREKRKWKSKTSTNVKFRSADEYDNQPQNNSPTPQSYRGTSLQQQGNRDRGNQNASRGFYNDRGGSRSTRGGDGRRQSYTTYNQRESYGDQDGGGYFEQRSENRGGNWNQRGRGNFNRGRGNQGQRWFHRRRLQNLMEEDGSRSPVKGVRRQ
jgi:hypothetical protein